VIDLKKRQLEKILQNLKEPVMPKPSLEQYTINGGLASEIINLAQLHGDIEGKVVFDHGCGAGRLAVGAAMFGARLVIGIDIDKQMIKLAKENLQRHEVFTDKHLPVFFVVCDLKNWHARCDTVVQNPPFGIQTRHADRMFIEKAFECGQRIYSLHKDGYAKTRNFLTGLIEANGGSVEKVIKYKFRIPHMFRFHRRPNLEYDVDLYICGKKKQLNSRMLIKR